MREGGAQMPVRRRASTINIHTTPKAATSRQASRTFQCQATSRSSTPRKAAMLLPRIFAPIRASCHAPSVTSASSSRIFDILRLANGVSAPPSVSFKRHASHQAQGRANGAKDGPGKRLGAKKSGGTSLPNHCASWACMGSGS